MRLNTESQVQFVRYNTQLLYCTCNTPMEHEHTKSVCGYHKLHIRNTAHLWKTDTCACAHSNTSLWPPLWPITQAALSHCDCSSSAAIPALCVSIGSFCNTAALRLKTLTRHAQCRVSHAFLFLTSLSYPLFPHNGRFKKKKPRKLAWRWDWIRMRDIKKQVRNSMGVFHSSVSLRHSCWCVFPVDGALLILEAQDGSAMHFWHRTHCWSCGLDDTCCFSFLFLILPESTRFNFNLSPLPYVLAWIFSTYDVEICQQNQKHRA